MRPQPLICARDVEASSRWYQRLLGLKSDHGGPNYERLVHNGRLILQLHRWEEEHHHGRIGDPDDQPPGNGLLLWFEIDDLDAAVSRANAMNAEILLPRHRNPLDGDGGPNHWEIWLRDPNGYKVVLASPDGTANGAWRQTRPEIESPPPRSPPPSDLPSPSVYVSEMVRQVERLYRDLLASDFRRLSIREQLDRQARRLVEGHTAGDRAVVPQITCWRPGWVGRSADEIMGGALSLDDARQTVAREYGFVDWSEVEAQGAKPPDALFEFAVDTLLVGDAETLRRLVERDPSLVHQRSSYGHRSTLLHYVGSNGVETWRQKVPLNLAEITRVLLAAGADVNAAASMYGGRSTPLGLLVTSDHPAKAGVTDEVADVLREAGAKSDSWEP